MVDFRLVAATVRLEENCAFLIKREKKHAKRQRHFSRQQVSTSELIVPSHREKNDNAMRKANPKSRTEAIQE
jgi:tRNA A37 N6-isopentenylltransferase MiaA